MAKLKDAARKSGLFIVSDSDLDFNQPVVRISVDRFQGKRSRYQHGAGRRHVCRRCWAAITSTASILRGDRIK